jgi:aminopeptidase N
VKFYLKAMQFSAATPDDLHRELQRAYDEDSLGNGVNLDAAMKTWEDQPGYPVINVTRSGSKFILTQGNYKGGNEIYTIPITYATKSKPNFNDRSVKFWMTTKTAEIDTDDWIIFNLGSSGYYKVNYDDELTQTILELVLNGVEGIPDMNKNEFIRNLIADTKADEVTKMKLLTALKLETDISLWATINENINFYYEKLLETRIYPKFQKFVAQLIEFHLNRLGYEKKENESQEDESLRHLVTRLACRNDQDSCHEFGLKKVAEFLETGKKSSFICKGLERSNASIYQKFMKLYSNDDHLNIVDHFEIIGCTRDKDVLLESIEILANSSEQADVFLFTRIQSRNEVSQKILFDYFIDHFQQLVTRQE